MNKLDQARCERAGGVKFSPGAWVRLESLAEYCELYVDPGAEGRRAPLSMAPDFKPPLTPTQQADILQILVKGVAEAWRENGGVKRERLSRLVRSLFEQAKVTPPAPRTLRRAVQTAYNCRTYPWPAE